MKAKDLLEFLEATNPEVKIKLRILTEEGTITAYLDEIEDDGVGVVTLTGA